MSRVYDCIVVGAGVVGSSTAYHLAKRGKRTLLLEQFFLPTSRGSSCGQTRIIRKATKASNTYGRMLLDSYRQWEEIAQECGEELWIDTDVLEIGPRESEDLPRFQASLDMMKVPYKAMNSKEIREQYPTLNYPEHYIGLLEKNGGILKAGKCIAAIQSLVKKYGGEIRDGTKMTKVLPHGDTTTVQTTEGDFYAQKVIITAGPWVEKILKSLDLHLPIVPMTTEVLYWKSKVPGEHSVKNKFPVIINNEKSGFYYAMPSLEYEDLCKISAHISEPISCDPDARNKVTGKLEHYKEIVGEYIQKCLPGIEDQPSIVEYCMYTKSPDVNFTLDVHPKHKNIFIATGFAGHGFKLAPTVGQLMAEMATDSLLSFEQKPFRISRFSRKTTSKL